MKKTIEIEGMSCKHCAMRVEKALAAVKGVRSAAVDLAGKKASVEGDALIDADLAATVAEAGYTAIAVRDAV